MSLVARVSLTGPPEDEPEDYLFSALGVIFPDDATNQHGDAYHSILYTSPHLPAPLHLTLADPRGEADRSLFSHYLWNASLLLAKLVEAATLGGGGGGGGGGGRGGRRSRAPAAVAALRGSGPVPPTEADAVSSAYCDVVAAFDVTGLATVELGAGTALPSLLAALLGAARVTVTDYPSDVVLDNLRANLARNVGGGGGSGGAPADPGTRTNPPATGTVTVAGHAWGVFTSDVAAHGHHAYDRVFVCDCLWMPWQHDNLRKSIDWFLREDEEDEKEEGGGPRCWVVAGFHTGRPKVAAFFDAAALAAANLEIEALWERDCDDKERPWAADRPNEDVTERKRWLVVGILRRARRRGAARQAAG